MNLVPSLLLAAAGLLASPARGELAGLSANLRARARDLQARALADEEDRAALRELRAEGSMPPSEGTGDAEMIARSGPTPADLAAALGALAADLDDPDKSMEDAAVDTLNALGAEVDGSFFDLDSFVGCTGYYYGGPPGLGSFTAACVCLAQLTGARQFGFRAGFCQIAGPLVDAVQSEVDTQLGTGVLVGVAQVLALIDPFVPAPAPPTPPPPPPPPPGYGWLNYQIAHDGSRGLKGAGLPPPQSVEELVEEIGEDVDLDGIHYRRDGLLSTSDCEALIRHYDDRSAHASPGEPFQAKEITLSRAEIASVIGEEAFERVLAFSFDTLGKAPVTAIVVRRTYADGVQKVGAMHWHMHEAIPGFKEGTVAVALNADGDVEGGDLFYLSRDGPVRAPRSRGRGYAFPHDTAHSVEPYSGVRYSLFVHTNLDQASEVRDV